MVSVWISKRYDVFCEIDTDFKKAKGGKGVGRLFWLDAFKGVRVESVYVEGHERKRRSFRFELNKDEQIVPTQDGSFADNGETGTKVTVTALRAEEYAQYFPRRPEMFLRYFRAQFIADFLIGGGPDVLVDIDGEVSRYPKEVTDLVVGEKLDSEPFVSADFGSLRIIGFACRPDASLGMDGNHQLHLLADGRTVESRKIDNLMGIKSLSREGANDLFCTVVYRATTWTKELTRAARRSTL